MKRLDTDLIPLYTKTLGVDSLQALNAVESDKQIPQIPIIMITTSILEEEIAQSCKQGAKGFMTKPTGFDDFSKLLTNPGNFWISASELPPRDSGCMDQGKG